MDGFTLTDTEFVLGWISSSFVETAGGIIRLGVRCPHLFSSAASRNQVPE
jgi:hypothetical protein